jgi:diacylglycerol kinase family enzyme
MTWPAQRVTVIHNDIAGGGGHDRRDLVEMILRAGYAVAYFNAADSDIATLLEEPADLVAVAGGDGTVRKIVAVAKPGIPPIAILPLGRANNIAKSLDIEGPAPRLIEGWRDARRQAFFPIAAETPWGRQRLVESIGFGALAQAIEELRGRKLPPSQARRRIAELVLRTAPVELDVHADDAALSGVFAVFEATTIPLVGPNLLLAPTAVPGNGLDICFAGASPDERRRLAAWLAEIDGTAPTPVLTRKATRVSITGRFGRVRLDDEVRIDNDAGSGTITLMPESEPLHFVVPV